MEYLYYVLVISLFGCLSGNFCQWGERNIGRAGGADKMPFVSLFLPAYFMSVITGFAPWATIILIGVSIGWMEAIYAFGVTLFGGLYFWFYSR